MSTSSVAGYCNLLGRSRLLSADEVRDLLRRWQAEAGPAVEDAEAFARWLVACRYLTEYQADALRRGHADRFFLGEYKLLERIGQGRMAGIYKAVHRLGQTVAIKVLPPSKVKDPQAFGRFQREARIALKLQHPNVVRTLEAGEDKGLHYIVMEHLDGETLEEMMRQRGRLPAAEAVPLLLQALQGLQHLHEQDVIHRDLKPANLMLVSGSPSPGETRNSTIKILDVGLGRALFDEGDPNSGLPIDLTVPGDILGNPDYMAPEQARDSHSADVRADIYSLGCILYHVLTGQPPFADTNTVRKVVRHATEAPRPLTTFNVEVPGGLELVLERMLAKDPAHRFPIPSQAAQALRAFVPSPPRGAHPPVPLALPVAVAAPVAPAPSPPASDEESTQRFHLSRRDWFLLAAGGVGVAAAVVIGVMLSHWFRGKREE